MDGLEPSMKEQVSDSPPVGSILYIVTKVTHPLIDLRYVVSSTGCMTCHIIVIYTCRGDPPPNRYVVSSTGCMTCIIWGKRMSFG